MTWTKRRKYIFLVISEKCYNNKKVIALHEWLSIFWLDGTKTQKTRCKNLQRFTVKGHNIRSKHISTANHKLLGVNGIRQHSSDEQNHIKTQGLPLVDGKECHFALRGGNYIRQALDCNWTANTEPSISTPLKREGRKKASDLQECATDSSHLLNKRSHVKRGHK